MVHSDKNNDSLSELGGKEEIFEQYENHPREFN